MNFRVGSDEFVTYDGSENGTEAPALDYCTA